MISVIIPVYNKELTIKRTVKSVLNQTYVDFELIIVDDGSTDKSLQIINDSFDDKRIRCVKQENRGVSVARNNGVKHSRGEWIAFLDADDIWLPMYLEEMYNAFCSNKNAVMIGCASYTAYFDSDRVSTNRMIDHCYDQVCKINFFNNPDIMSHIGATCIKKDIFIKIGGFDEKIRNNEDVQLIAKISLVGDYVYVGKMLHVYMLDVPGQVTTDMTKYVKHMKDTLDVINELYLFSRNKNNPLVDVALEFRFFDYILRFIKQKRFDLVDFYFMNIENGVVNKKFLYWMTKPCMANISKVYIYLIKIVWRFHGFQPRNHHSRFDKELQQEYKNFKSKENF